MELATQLTADNTWHHFCFKELNDSSRKLYRDGSTETDTSSSSANTKENMDKLNIGMFRFLDSSFHPWYGRIAEVGIWNAALDDEEVYALANGISPDQIRPASLVWYSRLIRDGTTLKGSQLNETGSVGVSNSNSMYYSG